MAESFGKYDVYATSGSMYCYVGTNVLRNHFGIRNADELKRIEADITTIRQHDLLSKPVTGRFTANHLCGIHRYLFGDIYPFAGRYRRESIAKGQTIFENPANIERKLKKLLAQLKEERFLKQTTAQDFLPRLAYYFTELNYLHPFREGNGRATREFVRQLLLVSGYAVDWSAVSVDELLLAMGASVFDTAPLIQALRKCVSRQTD
ncbi:MAG: Fic family protein [Oscillospiraceae bacterium]|nr:Fic family protein [Oscillospiraceae bacterium]